MGVLSHITKYLEVSYKTTKPPRVNMIAITHHTLQQNEALYDSGFFLPTFYFSAFEPLPNGVVFEKKLTAVMTPAELEKR